MATVALVPESDRAIEGLLDRTRLIGDFYVLLMTAMIGGNPNPSQHNEHHNRADINMWDWGLRIEVKSSTNQSSPRMWASQLNGFQETLGDFFGSDFWYALFFYLSREGRAAGQARRISAETPTVLVLQQFLCQNTRLLGLLDISVIRAMAEWGMVSQCLHRGKQEELVQLSETTLKGFVDDSGTFAKLGLDCKKLSLCTYHVTGSFEGIQLGGFRVIQVLPPQFHAKVVRAVRKNFTVQKA